MTISFLISYHEQFRTIPFKISPDSATHVPGDVVPERHPLSLTRVETHTVLVHP